MRAAAVMVDAVKKHHSHELDLVKRIQEYKIPSCLLLNKADLVPHAAPLLEVAATFKDANPNFEHIYPISALNGEGIETVRVRLSDSTCHRFGRLILRLSLSLTCRNTCCPSPSRRRGRSTSSK